MNAALEARELSPEELTALDWIVCVDHSGSMGAPSTRMQGKDRMAKVKEDVIAIARLAEQYDDDGITAIGFSSAVSVKDGVTASAVETIFREFAPRGSTNRLSTLR